MNSTSVSFTSMFPTRIKQWHRNTLWKAHYVEYPIELVVVIWVAGLNVLLTTVKDRFRRHQFGKDASDCPYI